jgi:transcription elongation factor GreB
MRKKFARKPQRDEPATPGKNYITPSGLERLKDEHRFLLTRERPAVTEVVTWAASTAITVTRGNLSAKIPSP